MAALLAGCSVVQDQLKQPGPSWPKTRDKRVWFDGLSLRVRTQSGDSAEAADDEALAALQAYFEKLKVLGEPPMREARIKAALKRAVPFNGRGAKDVYRAEIEIPLQDVQQLLGTSYE